MRPLILALVLAGAVASVPSALACQDDEHAEPVDDALSTIEQIDEDTWPHCTQVAETTPNPPFIHFYDDCMCPTPDGSSVLCDFLP